MRINAKKIIYFMILIMMIFSSIVVVQFSGRTLFLFLQIIFCITMLFYKSKIYFTKYKIINLMLFELILAAISAIISDIPASYKKTAVVMLLYEIPMYFTLTFLNQESKRDFKILPIIIKGLKIMCILQLCWIPIQYLLYHLIGLDINDLIFNKTLHLIERASFIRSWKYYPSGFSWHSAVLAPMFVLAFLLFKSPVIRILIVMDAILCGSSTSIIGVVCCAGILVLYKLKDSLKGRIQFNLKKILVAAAVIIIALVIAYKVGFMDSLLNQVQYLYVRLSGQERDSSTEAHLSYYTDYFKVLKISTPIQILFGYGYGCSGYPISKMYGRYAGLSNWAVECDIVNILISRGIVGFVLYYTFLGIILWKGRKIDRRYVAFILPVMIEGLGYNVQWAYVYFLEVIMFFTIQNKINFFEYVNQKKQDTLINQLKMHLKIDVPHDLR